MKNLQTRVICSCLLTCLATRCLFVLLMSESYRFEYELEYEKSLASLSGILFQQEVSIRLGKFIDGFQTVPPYPQGDGSLDGISHFGEQAYCCYGLEHDEFKTPAQRT